MKGKLKLIILLMLALFLVACGSASPGGGTTPIPKVERDPIEYDEDGDWKSIKNKIAAEVKDMTDLPVDDEKAIVYLENQRSFYIDDGYKVVYETKLFKGKDEVGITTIPGSHLKFKSDFKEVKFRELYLEGNVYFIEKRSEPREYLITFTGGNHIDFNNRGNIYVMDGNYGSTLKINGNYFSYGGKINLGLYVSKDGEKFSTDKVHINGNAEGQTKVNFIYNEKQVKGLKDNAEYHGEDKDNFVIKVDGDVLVGENTFEMTPFPKGLNVFDFKYYKKEGATDSHLWKLEKKK